MGYKGGSKLGIVFGIGHTGDGLNEEMVTDLTLGYTNCRIKHAREMGE